MSKIDIEIEKTEELFEKMNKQVKNYIDNMDSFFGEILSNESWLGPSAVKYKEIVSREKNVYYNFGDAIEKFVDNSKSSIDDLKLDINNNTLE